MNLFPPRNHWSSRDYHYQASGSIDSSCLSHHLSTIKCLWILVSYVQSTWYYDEIISYSEHDYGIMWVLIMSCKCLLLNPVYIQMQRCRQQSRNCQCFIRMFCHAIVNKCIWAAWSMRVGRINYFYWGFVWELEKSITSIEVKLCLIFFIFSDDMNLFGSYIWPFLHLIYKCFIITHVFESHQNPGLWRWAE